MHKLYLSLIFLFLPSLALAQVWQTATSNNVGIGSINPGQILDVQGNARISGTVIGSNLTGTSSGANTGDQTITLTSDVTGAGTGSFATTIKSSVALAGNPTTTTQTASDNSTRIATTAYVTTGISNAVAAVNPAVAVQAATTAAGDTSGLTYNNGVSGIGATLTGSNNTAITVDGYTFTAVGQRLLVKDDTQSPSGAFNGVYYVTQIQTAILPPILTRALDYDMPSDINNTGAIPVINGTVNISTTWVITSQVNTVGTDPLTYVEFSLNPAVVVQTSRTIATTAPLAGGGDLSSNRTLTCNVASGSQPGCLASADWTTFNNKGSGTVTSVATASPLIGSFTTSGTIGIGTATPSTDGYLKGSDFTTFNNKQAAGNYITALTGSDGTASGPGSVAFTLGSLWKGWSYTSPNVSLATITDSVGIGTTLAQGGLALMSGNLGIGTWAPQAALVVTSGNVGIGSKTPGTILDIQGTARTTGFQLNSSPNAGYLLVGGTTGIGTWMAANTLPVSSASTTGVLNSTDWSTFNGKQANLSLTAGTYSDGKACTYTTSGTVLNCNTTLSGGSPGGGLNAVQYNSPAGTFAGDSTKFSFNGSNIGIATTDAMSELAVKGGIGVGTISYSPYLTTITPDGNLIIEKNVGIGTWQANSGLIVNAGNIGVGSLAPGQSIDSNGAIRALGAGDSTLNIGGGNVGIGTTLPSSILEVGLQKFSVLSGGNVGIGTILPQTKFAVLGNVGIGTWVANNSLQVIGGVGIGTVFSGISYPPGTLVVGGPLGIGTAAPTYNGLTIGGGAGIQIVGVGTTSPRVGGWTAGGKACAFVGPGATGACVPP